MQLALVGVFWSKTIQISLRQLATTLITLVKIVLKVIILIRS